MSHNHYELHPFFMPAKYGKCFVLEYIPAPEFSNKQSVLIIPPFAEENNNSRKMHSAIARKLANEGFSVFMIDLFGTGDSEGQFIDALWDDWLDNIKLLFENHLKQKFIKTNILATRLGVLMLVDLFDNESLFINKCLLLQPVLKGKTFTKQLMRTKIAAMAFKGEKCTQNDLQQALEEQGLIEISGYQISKSMLDKIESKSINDAFLESINIITIDTKPKVEDLILLDKQNSKSNNNKLISQSPPFWTTTEYEISEHLVKLIEAALESA